MENNSGHVAGGKSESADAPLGHKTVDDLAVAAQEALRLIDWLDLIAKDGVEIYKHEIRCEAERFRSRIAPALDNYQSGMQPVDKIDNLSKKVDSGLCQPAVWVSTQTEEPAAYTWMNLSKGSGKPVKEIGFTAPTYIPTDKLTPLYTHPAKTEQQTSAQPDRNLDGAAEFITAILMNQPIWPNSWGQDVAAAAYFIHRQDSAQSGINPKS